MVHQLPRLRNEGFSSEVLEQLSRARVASTNNTYNSKWKLFTSFCDLRGVDPFGASSAVVAEFLLHVAQTRNASVNTLAGYRSAIGNVLRLTTGFDPGNCPILSQLMKSFRRTQPPPSRRIPQWDVGVVLQTLARVENRDDMLSGFLLTAKTIFLVALASGERRHAIAALTTPPVFTDDLCTLHFNQEFVPKCYFVKKNQSRIKPLSFPKLRPDALRQVCVCRTVESYVARVAEHRKPQQSSLFIPHNVNKSCNLSPQAVARYITKLIAWCYNQQNLETPVARAHDVRKIAATLADLSATALEDVLEAGSWSSSNTFLKHYRVALPESQQLSLKSFEGVIVGKSVLHLQEKPVTVTEPALQH